MFNSNSSAITTNNSTNSNQEEVTIMSNIDSIKNDILSHITVRGLAVIGATALALSTIFGAGNTAHADGFEFSPEWRVHLEQDAAEEQARAAISRHENASFTEADLLAAYQGNVGYGVPLTAHAVFTEADLLAAYQGNVLYGASTNATALVQFSPEWTVHLEADAYEVHSAGAHVISTFSPEWTVLLERDALETQSRVGYVISQPLVLSPEWAAFLATESLITGYQRPATVLGQ